MTMAELDSLHWFPIRADFADALLCSGSGGVIEIEAGGLCTNEETAKRLEEKILAAFETNYVRDISLYLTDVEAMCLAVAACNCATNGLPKAQRDRVDKWFEKWRKWSIEVVQK